MKIAILDGHAINPGDLSGDALRSLGNLKVSERALEVAIASRAFDAEALHIAWATKETRRRLIELVVANLRAFIKGHPINVVD